MTGNERMQAALSPAGCEDVPVVMCYPGIFVRDHFTEVCTMPWWTMWDPDPQVQARFSEEVNAALGLDWYEFRLGSPREAREAITFEIVGEQVYHVDRRTGVRSLLPSPVPGGEMTALHAHAPVIDDLEAFLQAQMPQGTPFTGLLPGQDDLPKRLMSGYGADHFSYHLINAPQWEISGRMGYEQYLTLLASDPEPIFAAARRHLFNSIQQVKAVAAAGCHGIWIEEGVMDMIGPRRYAQYVLPLVQELVQAVREAGMASIHYYCGDPWPAMDLLLETGADALALEEGKKHFSIDIDDVVARVQGKMAVFGNLDAIGVLEQGSLDDLRTEITRQLCAGRRNGNRFIMSTGSPVTPGTPLQRVREYAALVREVSDEC